MILAKSFSEAQKLYNLSVNLANSWISKYYPNDNHQIFGVPLEKIQAFSQHHFFSCLLEGKLIDDIWSQYPAATAKPLGNHLLKRSLQVVKNLAEPEESIGYLSYGTQIVFLASGRHLADWQPAIFYLQKHFKILVVGKIPDGAGERFAKQKIPAINLTSARKFLTRQERLVDLAFFLRFFWQKQEKHQLLDNLLWGSRLWYLRLEQLPEISALLKFAHNLFEKTKPALLLTTSSNDTFGASFALIAQKLKIPVAELQHGYTNVGTDVPFYNSDYQLVWGQIPQKIRKNYGKKSLIVGCPIYKKPSFNKRNTQVNKSNVSVLVLWSPPFGTISLFKCQSNQKTARELVMGLAKLPMSFNITLRSHPSHNIKQDLDRLPLPSNIVVSNAGKIEKVIIKSDVVVTQPSTAGFVAAVYKKPLIFFNNSWITKEFGDPMVNSGSALNVDLANLRKVDQYILKLTRDKNLLKKQKQAQEKFVKEYCSYFGEESISQINLFAKKIIQGVHV